MSYRIAEGDEFDLSLFTSLRGKGGHFAQGLFIAEAPKLAEKFLRSTFEVVYAYLTEDYLDRFRQLLERHVYCVAVRIAEKEEMERIVGYPLHQGIMLAARIPAARPLAEYVVGWREPFTVLVLDSIADPENMGLLIRNAAAFGADAVIMDSQSCSPYLRRAVRVSMGTIVDIPIVLVDDLPQAIQQFHEFRPGMTAIAAALTPSATALSEVNWGSSVAVVLGSEGHGLRDSVVAACDVVARIPMAEGVDSLNVGVAAGIFLYEATRR